LTDVQTWQLVSYIRSLQGAAPAARATSASTIPVAGDVAAGETTFFGRAGCSACHEVNGRGGITGPDLSAVGRLSAEALRQKIVAPNTPLPAASAAGGRGAGGGRGAPAPVTLVVKTQDGRELRGVRRNEDNFSLQMVDASGHLQLLDKAKLGSIAIENKSLMPADYTARLSAAEVTNLVAYLHGLAGRDLSKTAAQPMTGGITFERLKNSKAEPQNWLMYWGDFQGTHYSPLNQITTRNVKNLKERGPSPVPGNTTLEATPSVVDGVMYVTSSGDPLTVMALDARHGRPDLAVLAPAEGEEPVRESTRTTAAWPCWAIGSMSGRSMRR
jgi:alcohol dehydrogenase (cytochrome c)